MKKILLSLICAIVCSTLIISCSKKAEIAEIQAADPDHIEVRVNLHFNDGSNQLSDIKVAK